MRITEVRLENVKSYGRQVRIPLKSGINALIGENGAGKSTVVEAIGAALFGDLPYTHDQFVRRGERSGSIIVGFISALDGREYQAVRQVGRGATWYIYDEEVGVRLAEGEKAASEFLRQHLRLDPSTDLRRLFQENIGPPQGTLTAPFLGPPAARKARYDPVLGVDDYEKAFQALLPAKNHLQDMRSRLEVSMAELRASVARRSDVEAARQDAHHRALEAQGKLVVLEASLREVAERRQALDRAEASLREQQARVDRQRDLLEAARHECQQVRGLVAEAEEARAQCQRLAPQHTRWQELDKALAGLEARRAQRDRLLEERGKALRERDRAESRLKEAQERLQESETALADLRELARQVPDVAELGPATSVSDVEQRFQRAVDQAQEMVKKAALAAQEVAKAREVLRIEEERLAKVSADIAAIQDQIAACEASRPLAERLAELKDRASRAQQAYADARAALEVTRRARTELATGLCPILREPCQNVQGKSGGDLASYFQQQQAAGERAVESARQVLESVEKDLKRAMQAAEMVARLKDLGALRDDLRRQEEQVAANMEKARHILEEHADAPERLELAEQRRRELEGQRARAHHLATLARQAADRRRAVESSQQDLETSVRRLAEVEQELLPFSTLDDEIRKARSERDSVQADHEEFLRQEAVAAALEERQRLLAEAIARETAISKELALAQEELDRRKAAYDPEAHKEARGQHEHLIALVAATRAEVEAARRLEADKQQELESIARAESQLALMEAEAGEISEAIDLCDHVRFALKATGPQMARALLREVSSVASGVFADIMGDASMELEWTEDYDIVVRQAGAERRFRQLSGGEQMSAALAVRLALSRLLGDLRLVILDEPTAHMDDRRRANLADQVDRLRGYDQLILVSHSDEFDGMFGHIVYLAKRDGATVLSDGHRDGRKAGVGEEARED